MADWMQWRFCAKAPSSSSSICVFIKTLQKSFWEGTQNVRGFSLSCMNALQEKRHNITSILQQKNNNRGNIYTIASLSCFLL